MEIPAKTTSRMWQGLYRSKLSKKNFVSFMFQVFMKSFLRVDRFWNGIKEAVCGCYLGYRLSDTVIPGAQARTIAVSDDICQSIAHVHRHRRPGNRWQIGGDVVCRSKQGATSYFLSVHRFVSRCREQRYRYFGFADFGNTQVKVNILSKCKKNFRCTEIH